VLSAFAVNLILDIEPPETTSNSYDSDMCKLVNIHSNLLVFLCWLHV